MPYFPSSSELPANRFLLFADQSRLVRVMDESEVQKKGLSFTARWQSPSLNRGDPTKEYTLRKLVLFYDSESATTITVRASGDGGATWNETNTVSLLSGDNLRAVTGFNTTGFDLRFEIRFDQDVVSNVYGYKARLVERSDILLP